MSRWILTAALTMLVPAVVPAAGISGKYVEARTCDVFTGACFANADTGFIGRHAVLGWQIESGSYGDVRLDGLGVVAVVAARETLGLKQHATARAILIVDAKADAAQREALVGFARRQGGELLRNVLAVESAPIEIDVCGCKGETCAKLTAGAVKVETRCLDLAHDKACGNELAFYPPLAAGVTAKPAVATEHSYAGKGFNETWKDADRRGAYVGAFATN